MMDVNNSGKVPPAGKTIESWLDLKKKQQQETPSNKKKSNPKKSFEEILKEKLEQENDKPKGIRR